MTIKKPKPFSFAELLETARVVLCATDSARARSLSHCQTGEASRRLMVCSGDDSAPQFSVQLAINCPCLLAKAGFMKFLVG